MPQLRNHEHNYEPSREIKQLYLKTRKADPALGGTPHPGLFQTAQAGGDALGLTLALLLEIYGLANLIHVGSIPLPAALALVAVDIAGALLSHYRQGNRCRIRCLIAVTNDPAEKARIRHRDTLRDGAIRTVGLAMIAGSAAWKMVSFSTIGGLNDTPPAVITLVCMCYFAAALLHIRCTGWALAELWLTVRMEIQRRRTLSEDPATAPCGIHGFRTHSFDSQLPLHERTVEDHALVAIGGKRYTLRTSGLLLDHDVATLAAAQDGPEARDIVRREGLRAQHAMLDQEPVRPSTGPAAARRTNDEMPNAESSRKGIGLTAMPSVRKAALLAISAAIAGSFGGCGNPPQPVRSISMDIVMPASALTEEHKLPEALIDLIAPSGPTKSDGKTLVVVPTISLAVLGDGNFAPVTIKPQANPGWVARSYGVTAPAARQLANAREQLQALKLVPSADGSSPDTTASIDAATSPAFWMSSHLFDEHGKPLGTALAFDPNAADPQPLKVGERNVAVFNDPAAARNTIADAVKTGETKFTMLYAAADLLSPPMAQEDHLKMSSEPPKLENSGSSTPTVADQPVELRTQPRIISLNEQYTHATLVEKAEMELTIYFSSGSSELSFQAVKAIERLAKSAVASRNLAGGQWIVVGYADSKGKMENNDHLSLGRSIRTAAEMSSCGMAVSIVAGAGVTRPAESNETSEGRAGNRRVIIYWKPSTTGN
jgi:outer membrane protein OmpA-like peptidoglycan-associated protein